MMVAQRLGSSLVTDFRNAAMLSVYGMETPLSQARPYARSAERRPASADRVGEQPNVDLSFDLTAGRIGFACRADVASPTLRDLGSRQTDSDDGISVGIRILPEDFWALGQFTRTP